MTDLPTIAANLGITEHALSRRLRRGWSIERATTAGRMERELQPIAKAPKPRVQRDIDYRKSWHSWPMTEDQRRINEVLMAWR